MGRAKKSGKVSVELESCKGKLRLRLPREVYAGKQRFLTFVNLTDTPENRLWAESKAREVESDIISGNFDTSLAKYRQHANLAPAKPAGFRRNAPPLAQLWEGYTEHRKPMVAESTLQLTYKNIANHIRKLPFQEVEDAGEIGEYLLEHYSVYLTKRILTQLNACCNWACELSLIDDNPFRGMAEKIKLVEEERDIDPFTCAERDAIIKGFQEHDTYCHYTSFVKFLFATGCRTSEAVALQWKHISEDCSQITFSEAVVYASSYRIRKDTKTHKPRNFPCNASLQRFLKSIEPWKRRDEEALVFPSLTGIEINTHTFNALCWKGTTVHGEYLEGIVTRLVREGKVERYRSQYHTRHTFITECIKAGVSVVEVGEWVGSSAEVIIKHYAEIMRRYEVPEF